MGEWGYATFFRTTDLDALEREVTRACEAEGLDRVAYAPRTRDQWDAMQYGTGASSDRWSLAFGLGRAGWSIVRTAPFELLAEPNAQGALRLGAIARALGCAALHVSLYDGVAMVVAEATPTGAVALSGYTMEGPVFHGLAIDEARFAPTIAHADVPPSVHAALQRYLPDGFDALLDHLADARWASVGLALVAGHEVPDARVLSFARRVDVDAAPLLRVRLAVEEHPLGQRYLLDDDVWLSHGSIDAIDETHGAAFLAKISAWLRTPLKPRALEAGVPLGSFALLAPAAEEARRPDRETQVVSIGGKKAVSVLLHTDVAGSYAELEERSPAQREALIAHLTRALVGKRQSPDAVYGAFERVFTEPSPHAVGTFAGDRIAASWWRRLESAVLVEGHAVFEVDGLCNAIAATRQHVALALVTPGHVNARSQGIGQSDPARVVLIDVETGAMREVLRSDEHLHFGFTRLCFRGQVLGVRAERDGAEVIVTLEGDTVREEPGDFGPWAREAIGRGLSMDGLYDTYETAMMWAGPDAVVMAGAPLAVLDLKTNERRALLEPAGLEPVACSSSGDRCLAKVDDRRLFVGRRRPGA